MTDEQFTALATLMRMQPGGTREAVRLVLVAGESTTAAAVACGVSAQSVSNAVGRCRRAAELAAVAAGRA